MRMPRVVCAALKSRSSEPTWARKACRTSSTEESVRQAQMPLAPDAELATGPDGDTPEGETGDRGQFPAHDLAAFLVGGAHPGDVIRTAFHRDERRVLDKGVHRPAELFAANATRLLDGHELINRVNTVEFY
ncbi:hypothetical protein [Streptomyces javensis]